MDRRIFKIIGHGWLDWRNYSIMALYGVDSSG